MFTEISTVGSMSGALTEKGMVVAVPYTEQTYVIVHISDCFETIWNTEITFPFTVGRINVIPVESNTVLVVVVSTCQLNCKWKYAVYVVRNSSFHTTSCVLKHWESDKYYTFKGSKTENMVVTIYMSDNQSTRKVIVDLKEPDVPIYSEPYLDEPVIMGSLDKINNVLYLDYVPVSNHL